MPGLVPGIHALQQRQQKQERRVSPPLILRSVAKQRVSKDEATAFVLRDGACGASSGRGPIFINDEKTYFPGQPRMASSATFCNSSRLAPAAARTDKPSSTVMK